VDHETDLDHEKEVERKAIPIAIVFVLLATLLPYPVIWFGMNSIKSAAWSLGLYHFLCLIPAIIWGRSYWLKDVHMPGRVQIVALIIASVLFSCSAFLVYTFLGDMILSSEGTMKLLFVLGYTKEIFWPLSIYFVVVNSILEELFWRGVILNKIDEMFEGKKHYGIIWSSLAYGAFHYPILQLVVYPGWAEIGAVLLAVYGAFLAVLYRLTRSIVIPCVAHAMLTDLSAIVLLVALFQRMKI
jgi:membrane protease YdiL (CAAX protease family)